MGTLSPPRARTCRRRPIIKWISQPFHFGGEDVRACFLCEAPRADFKCRWCQYTYYCSTEHYAHHRVNSKCTPFFRAKESLFSARKLPAGELILEEVALLTSPGLHTPPTCPFCLRRLLGEAKSIPCPQGCPLRLCTFCSKGGKAHDGPECSVLRENRVKVDYGDYGSPLAINSVITLLRMLDSKQERPSDWSHFFRKVPMEERRKARGEWDLFQKEVVDYIRGRLFMGTKHGNEELHYLLGLFVTHSVPLGPLRGRGLFPIFSLLQYDCIGNCRFSVEGGRLTLRSRVPLEKDEVLTVNRFPSVLGTLKRQKRLKSLFHSECACNRCADPTECGTFVSALSCEACETGILLPNRPLEPLSEWSCSHCDFLLCSTSAERIIDRCEEELSEISVGRNTQKLEDFIAHYEGRILHKDHYLLLLAKRNYVLISRKDRITSLASSRLPPGPVLTKEELYEDFWWIIQRLALEDIF